MNDQDILTCAAQAGAWLLDRRERLEKHEHESTALLWLSVSEIAAIIDSFDALEAMHGLTLDERVLRDDSPLTNSSAAANPPRSIALQTAPRLSPPRRATCSDLKVKASTLLAWAREERVPCIRLGPRHLRWTRALLRQVRDESLDPGRRF